MVWLDSLHVFQDDEIEIDLLVIVRHGIVRVHIILLENKIPFWVVNSAGQGLKAVSRNAHLCMYVVRIRLACVLPQLQNGNSD
jgi:hypothetical protein